MIPIPRFSLTRLKQEDGAKYFGPFPNSGALRAPLLWFAANTTCVVAGPLTPE